MNSQDVVNMPLERVWKMTKDADQVIPKVLPQFFASSERLSGDGGAGTVRLVTLGSGRDYFLLALARTRIAFWYLPILMRFISSFIWFIVEGPCFSVATFNECLGAIPFIAQLFLQNKSSEMRPGHGMNKLSKNPIVCLSSVSVAGCSTFRILISFSSGCDECFRHCLVCNLGVWQFWQIGNCGNLRVSIDGIWIFWTWVALSNMIF